jgi:hypothetical protein
MNVTDAGVQLDGIGWAHCNLDGCCTFVLQPTSYIWNTDRYVVLVGRATNDHRGWLRTPRLLWATEFGWSPPAYGGQAGQVMGSLEPLELIFALPCQTSSVYVAATPGGITTERPMNVFSLPGAISEEPPKSEESKLFTV